MFHDLWWWIAHRTFKRFHVLKVRSLKPGWNDRDFVLLHASFQILKDYVEREKPFEIINWDSDDGHRKAAEEIKALYHWWTEVYPNRKEDMDRLLDQEDEWYREEDENLARLIRVRSYLWT